MSTDMIGTTKYRQPSCLVGRTIIDGTATNVLLGTTAVVPSRTVGIHVYPNHCSTHVVTWCCCTDKTKDRGRSDDRYNMKSVESDMAVSGDLHRITHTVIDGVTITMDESSNISGDAYAFNRGIVVSLVDNGGRRSG
jgi:hypothetical protein